MREIVKTIKAYKFSELEPEAQQHAIEESYAHCGYAWADDAIASIQALANHFDGKMTDWPIDWLGSLGGDTHATFGMPEMTKTEIRKRLKELGTYNRKTGKGNGDCKLTGFCMDEDAIDGFRAAFKAGETDLTELMDAAFDSWFRACRSDCEYQNSVESFTEHCEANGYEFTEEGDLL